MVLRRLSIFMGGWTLEAAEYVCDNPNMLDLLTHLVDKSLVVLATTNPIRSTRVW
jgi:hypothetical protein